MTKQTDVQLLAGYAKDADLFHTPEKQAYITFNNNGHLETTPIDSTAFRSHLTNRMWKEVGGLPTKDVLDSAINYMRGVAMFDNPEKMVNIRVARSTDGFWLDLGSDKWNGVHVTPTGWEVKPLPVDIKFRRQPGLLALPEPTHGGSMLDLRPMMNLDTDEDWVMVSSWLLGAIKPTGPYPLLLVHGEQGSAKSTMSRLLRGVIDPNSAPLRSAPKNGQDLMIAAVNSWIIGIDNMSTMSHTMSDDLCRISTGGGYSSRQLYTNDNEYIISATRPVLLNGIEEFAARADLLDRSIYVHCPPITMGKRKREADIYAEFAAIHPGVLGSLLDAASLSLANTGKTYDSLPRMADFSSWVMGGEPKMPFELGQFVGVYTTNRKMAADVSLMSVPISEPLIRLARQSILWQGEAEQLLGQLNVMALYTQRNHKDWPTSGWHLSNQLRRITNPLQEQGITIEFRRGGGKRRIIIKAIATKDSSIKIDDTDNN
jgi:hypothetical protein